MFDFHKLQVYQRARIMNKALQKVCVISKIKPFLRDQLYRASLSMVINIAEGTGKSTYNDRKNFYIIARGSVFECASLLDILEDEGMLDKELVRSYTDELEIISRMLSSLVNNFIERGKLG